MTLTERAPAKVNLYLHVHGRRPDGYHELESLVAFADSGDELLLTPGEPFRLTVEGPFAAALDGPNLVARAVEAAMAAAPALACGAFRLRKHLPVAAGVGGGSADAAAALRLLQRLNPLVAANVDWHALAQRLGADVPVCLAGRAALMSGIGERLAPLPAALPPAWCVLVNPRVPLATGDVFRALAAPPVVPPAASVPGVLGGPKRLPGAGAAPTLCDTSDLIRYLAARRNDLEPPAVRLCAPIADVLSALRRLDGCHLVRMSGSGPTCFALFDGEATARAAAAALASDHPGWWVEATRLA